MHTSDVLTDRHIWKCGDLAEVVAGPLRGLTGFVDYIYVDHRHRSILGIRPQGAGPEEVEADDVIPR